MKYSGISEQFWVCQVPSLKTELFWVVKPYQLTAVVDVSTGRSDPTFRVNHCKQFCVFLIMGIFHETGVSVFILFITSLLGFL